MQIVLAKFNNRTLETHAHLVACARAANNQQSLPRLSLQQIEAGKTLKPQLAPKFTMHAKSIAFLGERHTS